MENARPDCWIWPRVVNFLALESAAERRAVYLPKLWIAAASLS